MFHYMGMPVIENNWLIDKMQNKVHKKKRINKKWMKRYGFKEIPKRDVLIVGNSIIGHPLTIAKLMNIH